MSNKIRNMIREFYNANETKLIILRENEILFQMHSYLKYFFTWNTWNMM